MKTSMFAELKIFKNAGDGKFSVLNEESLTDISVGGFVFDIGQHRVPFDWKVVESGWTNEGAFSFSTGRGWFFYDFDLEECYDEEYLKQGLSRESLSAEFLSSVHHIEDFYINFVIGDKECDAGLCSNNGDNSAAYKIELIKVGFEDVETGKCYDVRPEVLAAYNKGERGVYMFDNILADASQRSRAFSGVINEDIGVDKESLDLG